MSLPGRAPGRAPAPAPAPGTVILGIDPGTRVLGYGALVCRGGPARLLAAGTLHSRAPSSAERLGEIRGDLDALLEELRPQVVVVEEAFAGRNLLSALKIGEARGVVLSAATHFGARVFQYPPALAKKVIVGNGAAHKSQVALCVAAELGLREPPEPLDVTDALALALTYIHRTRTQLQP